MKQMGHSLVVPLGFQKRMTLVHPFLDYGGLLHLVLRLLDVGADEPLDFIRMILMLIAFDLSDLSVCVLL